MESQAKKTSSKKRKRSKQTTQTSKAKNIDMEASEATEIPSHTILDELDVQHNHSAHDNNVVQEDTSISHDSSSKSKVLKKARGLTKMKDIAVEPGSRVHIEFTDKGEPFGKGSVTLSSYMGPLVREHVPVTLNSWSKLGDDKKIVLWKSIQARFDLDEEWQKAMVLKSMGCIWRASKSRLVKLIRNANNEEERIKLQPKNIQSRVEWRKFIKEKTSSAFKSISEKYKAIRHKQISHTCSRKGMAGLAQDMKRNSADPTSVSRVKVWIRSRTKKDGKPINTAVSETIEKLNELEFESPSSSRTDVRNDSLSKVLGQDKNGRVRGMGRGMTITKLSLFQTHDKYVSQMENRIKQLEKFVSTLGKNQAHESEEVDKTSSKGEISNFEHHCKLVDLGGTNEIVAEGRVISFDKKDLVDHIPLGPNAMKVLVKVVIKPNAFLWRPTANMAFIKEAHGKTIAWHSERVILQPEEESEQQENYNFVAPTDRKNKCKLFDWTGKDEVVAEGYLHSTDPNALVNGIPLGPNAMIVSVDIPKIFDAYLWRPSAADMRFIKDAINSTVAWPADRVILEKTNESEEENLSSPLSVNTNNVNKKCKLLDACGSGQIVAEGRWSSNDPNQVVHFVPLGPNATRVWVETAKDPSASLWRSTSEMEFIEDAIGTTVAWPTDKVVMF